MELGKQEAEVRFTIEARKATTAQLEAGERLFSGLVTNARSGAKGRGGHGQRMLPRAFSGPPHSLTGGS